MPPTAAERRSAQPSRWTALWATRRYGRYGKLFIPASNGATVTLLAMSPQISGSKRVGAIDTDILLIITL